MNLLLAHIHYSAQLADLGNALWLLPYCFAALLVLMWEAGRAR